MEKSYLKTSMIESEIVVDKETGEVLLEDFKRHTFIANSKEEFFLVYSSLLAVFNDMEKAEIRVFSFLLQYVDGTKFSVDKSIRLEIAKVTNLNERTVYTTVKSLEKKMLIIKHDTGAYQVNPRYAFKGSTSDRNKALKAIIELGCINC